MRKRRKGGPVSIFITYSHQDKEWLEMVKSCINHMERTEEVICWADTDIKINEEWYDQIKKHMEKADIAIALLSGSFVDSMFCALEEIPYLSDRCESESLIFFPILIMPCLYGKMPWFKNRQVATVNGMALSEVDDPNAALIDILKKLNALITDFYAAPQRLRQAAGSWPRECYDITRLPLGGKELFGRENDIKWLDAHWERRVRVVSLIAGGGIGKSALVIRWLENLEKDRWRGAERVFGWSFYSQGSQENSAISADQFIDFALKWFGEVTPDPKSSPWQKGERLAELVRARRTLLVLDGLEPLQWASGDTGRIKDPALATLLEHLAANNPGLVLITSRLPIAGLDNSDYAATKRDLYALTKEAGRALLRVRGVRGHNQELERMSAAFENHALAVSLLASYLNSIEIPLYSSHFPELSRIPELPELKGTPDYASHRMLAAFAERFGNGAERQVLRLLGLFDRPATKGELDALRAAPAIPGLTDHLPTTDDWWLILEYLTDLGLVAPKSLHNQYGIDAHPLVREYFATDLSSEAAAVGHERLYRYLSVLPTKKLPDTLEEMLPLFLSVNHGCKAGFYNEVFHEIYRDRIQRGDLFFTFFYIGAFSSDSAALSNFFIKGTDSVVAQLDSVDRGVAINLRGYQQRGLGNLKYAHELLVLALKESESIGDWRMSSINCESLCELCVFTGKLDDAEKYAKNAIGYAGIYASNYDGLLVPKSCEIDKWARLRDSKIAIASVLHEKGEFKRSLNEFKEAEMIHITRCDTARRYMDHIGGFSYNSVLISLGRYKTVLRRATVTIRIARMNDAALSLALDYLSIGYAKMNLDNAYSEDITFLFDQAVEHFKRAGQQEYLPYGLLARAGYRRRRKEFAASRRDINDARNIAKRSEMRLHLIDCDLEESRLLCDENRFSDMASLVVNACEEISATKYHRRDCELKKLQKILILR